ncbi:nitronate monooxygenase [Herbaspirillum rhizosphaerae]|uniref:Propionate 3-nitronate monooxygenase n=1 Tax=Herbaspirillum rhizosphaerae TaxID=346179 RepID=A0ABW8Z7V5_9BURK
MNSVIATRLGLSHPIIQAPMAGVSTPRMAAAASNAGALGSLALGASNAAQAKELLAETRSLTSRPFNVNFFAHRPAQADAARDQAWADHLKPYFNEFGGMLKLPLREIYQSFVTDNDMQQLLLDAPPAAVSFHFGLPDASVIEALKKAGVFLMANATTLSEARAVEAAGVDAIVAQGYEAGGHRGVFDGSAEDEAIGTFALVRAIAHQTSLPVIAAGGIMDGQGIAAARMLGADAVQMGTAFLLTQESNASPQYRQSLTSSRAEHTKVTRAISGRGARGIANRIMNEVGAASAPAPSDYPIAYDAGKQLHALASQRGSHEFAAFWAGQGAPLIRAGNTAEIIGLLAEEYAAAVERLRNG